MGVPARVRRRRADRGPWGAHLARRVGRCDPVRYTTDAAALRTDHDGGVVWQREGSLVEVVDGLLTLPPPSTPGAPRLVTATHPLV